MNPRLYTDGACGLDKVGGWAWVLTHDDEFVAGDLGYVRDTTSQRMELTAAIEALEWFPNDWMVTVVSDSAYLTNCFLQNWWEDWLERDWKTSAGKPVKNRDLWELLLELEPTRAVEWEHVKGHNGDRWNEVCDQLAVHARTNRPKEVT